MGGARGGRARRLGSARSLPRGEPHPDRPVAGDSTTPRSGGQGAALLASGGGARRPLRHLVRLLLEGCRMAAARLREVPGGRLWRAEPVSYERVPAGNPRTTDDQVAPDAREGPALRRRRDTAGASNFFRPALTARGRKLPGHRCVNCNFDCCSGPPPPISNMLRFEVDLT